VAGGGEADLKDLLETAPSECVLSTAFWLRLYLLSGAASFSNLFHSVMISSSA